jgi:NDP-sugar pyrophosphorylase family protein
MIKRRDFVTRSAGVLATTSAATKIGEGFSILQGRPNETIRVAVVGVRGQGNAHIREYLRMENVEIAALCDIDNSVMARRSDEIEKAPGNDRRVMSICESCSRTSRSTPSRSPPPTIGTV